MYHAQGYKTATLVRIASDLSLRSPKLNTRPSRLPIFDEISVSQRLWCLISGYTVYQNLDTKLIWVKLSETLEGAAK